MTSAEVEPREWMAWVKQYQPLILKRGQHPTGELAYMFAWKEDPELNAIIQAQLLVGPKKVWTVISDREGFPVVTPGYHPAQHRGDTRTFLVTQNEWNEESEPVSLYDEDEKAGFRQEALRDAQAAAEREAERMESEEGAVRGVPRLTADSSRMRL